MRIGRGGLWWGRLLLRRNLLRGEQPAAGAGKGPKRPKGRKRANEVVRGALGLRALPSWIKAGGAGELFPGGAFGVGDLGWDFDSDDDKQIALAAAPLGQAAGSDAQAPTVLGARRDFDVHATVEGRD